MRLAALLCALVLSLTGCADMQASVDALNSGTAAPTTADPAAGPEKPAKEPAGVLCASVGFGGVKPHVAKLGHYLQQKHKVGTVYGLRAGSVSGSDHPAGLALDFMVYDDRALGDRIAADVLTHFDEWGVKYVIWRQRIHEGDGWEPMGDRGGATANHFDHVHLSFEGSAAPLSVSLGC